MKFRLSIFPLSGPFFWLVVGAGLVGFISFLGGFFGPLFLSTSNLGPLLGIFVTGPVGVLVGALAGCVLWARDDRSPRLNAVWKWIAGIWLVNLLYTLLMIRVTTRGALFGVAVQILILGAVALLMYLPGTRIWLSRGVKLCGPIVLVALGVVVLMTLFPPVMRPWWGSPRPQPDAAASATLPLIAFLLHPGFDASLHVPLYAVNSSVLIIEWTVAAVGGAIACFRIAKRSGAGGAMGPAHGGDRT